jgi:hypothetical protein
MISEDPPNVEDRCFSPIEDRIKWLENHHANLIKNKPSEIIENIEVQNSNSVRSGIEIYLKATNSFEPRV